MASAGLSLVASGTALIACTYGLARYGYGLFLPSFRADFTLTSTLSGLLATGAFGSYCLAALLSARLVRTGRARLAAGLAGAAAAGGCLAVAAAPTATVLGCALLVAGTGAGLASPALVALVDRAVAAPSRPRAQTVVNAGTGLGVLVAGAVALALAESWRTAWVGFAALTLLATAATVRAAGPLGTEHPAALSRATSRTATRTASLTESRATGRSLRPAVLATLLAGIGSAGVWTFGRDLVVDAGDLGPLASTLFWALLGAAGVTGAVAGDVVQRWGVPRAWATFAGLLAAATAGLAVASGVPGAAFACGAAFGGSYVALSGVVIAWGTELRPESPGRANAMLFMALAAGQAAGASVVGGLADLVGPRPAFLVAAAVVAASCLPAVRRRSRRRCRDGTPAVRAVAQ